MIGTLLLIMLNSVRIISSTVRVEPGNGNNLASFVSRFQRITISAESFVSQSIRNHTLDFNESSSTSLVEVVKSTSSLIQSLAEYSACGKWHGEEEERRTMTAEQAILLVWEAHGLHAVLSMVRALHMEIAMRAYHALDPQEEMPLVFEALAGLAQATRDCAILLVKLTESVEDFLHDQEVNLICIYAFCFFNVLSWGCCRFCLPLRFRTKKHQ